MGIFDDWINNVKAGKPGPEGFLPGWTDLGARTGLNDPGKDSQSQIDQRDNLNAQGAAAGAFADQSQGAFNDMRGEGTAIRDMLRKQATGEVSLSSEQLRQGLQQNISAQRSQQASASPQNAAMAARQSAMNQARLGYGMSGQAAEAGIKEREAGANSLSNAYAQQRGQELQAALGSRQNAVNAYNTVKPEGSFIDKYGNSIAAALPLLFSDRNLKTDVKDGDKHARRIADGLKAHLFRYKDAGNGKGQQFGVMAQDMEKAGLGSAVIDTPKGKAVDGAKAATASLALHAALAKRVAELEADKPSSRTKQKGGDLRAAMLAR